MLGGGAKLSKTKQRKTISNPDKCKAKAKPYKDTIPGFANENKRNKQTNTHKFKKHISGVMTSTTQSRKVDWMETGGWGHLF